MNQLIRQQLRMSDHFWWHLIIILLSCTMSISSFSPLFSLPATLSEEPTHISLISNSFSHSILKKSWPAAQKESQELAPWLVKGRISQDQGELRWKTPCSFPPRNCRQVKGRVSQDQGELRWKTPCSFPPRNCRTPCPPRFLRRSGALKGRGHL